MIRNELESFVEKIMSARQERREFVSQNRRETQRFLATANRNRLNLSKETERNTNAMRDALRLANRRQKLHVERMLRDLHNDRQSQATQDRIQRSSNVAKNKRQIERTLRDNESQRKRNARTLRREAEATLMHIKSRVNFVKRASHMLTSGVANDLRACRRAWARLRMPTA